MPRKKISEYRAKTILTGTLGTDYGGVSVEVSGDVAAALKHLDDGKRYVVKVDQGVKGRFKKGLVKLGRTKAQLPDDIEELGKKGFEWVLVEAQLEHPAEAERYLAFERQRSGNVISFSARGGVDVESAPAEIRRAVFNGEVAERAGEALGLPAATLKQLAQAFDDNYFSFLEVNPLVVEDGQARLLDAAVEVDSEAEFFVDGRWTHHDFRQFDATARLPQMAAVEELASQSQASFRLAVLNPNGSIFLLLSGGGASVMLADEVFNQGLGKDLGNYGEYSGNPNTEETIIYTRQVLSLMLGSSAKHKVLVIAGGVANFTDVRATFKGVIAALKEVAADMRGQGIKVYVRRGGPFEAEGLAMMRDFLEKEGLLGEVNGPDMMLSEIIPRATAGMEARS
ncbi:MAG TPA: ATP citrate lyase citrate-binding domain-containing protein [Candidatus Saccharimonadia bacterium]|nr:ATP citrate lyase citrate-binding domain-containing protein [Candidatus Saccharimonadia bacterium]